LTSGLLRDYKTTYSAGTHSARPTSFSFHLNPEPPFPNYGLPFTAVDSPFSIPIANEPATGQGSRIGVFIP
jgi:hypothetical protein